ncbi:MAG: AMP-binding protein [Dermatophilaceae bacterium]
MSDPTSAHATLAQLFLDTVAAHPDRVAIDYYGTRLTYAQLDDLVGGLTAYLREATVGPGDRVGIYLQTSPHWVVTALAVWRLGAAVVPVNPMYRETEIGDILEQATPVAFIASAEGYRDVLATLLPDSSVRIVLTTSEIDLLPDPDPRVFGDRVDTGVDGIPDLLDAAREYAGRARPGPLPSPEDVALICFTSGTTGPAKGAILTHANVATNVAASATVLGLADGSVLFALAPMFHVVGLVLELSLFQQVAGTLVMPFRLVPDVAVELIRRTRPHFMVGPPTAFTAIAAVPGVTRDDLASFETLYAGGAPLPPALVERFEAQFGHYINNGYGLTETAAACVFSPPGRRGEIDEATNALANGFPFPGIEVRIVDEAGLDVPTGEHGEIALRGFAVTPGYWNRPQESAHAIRDGWFFTGDIGFVTELGVLFCVDRKKDMIIASGFKVWPGEVESVLYQHPAVAEVAVVGVADPYRGETVQAFVALSAGQTATPQELIDHCRDRMAAYKRPTVVHLVEALPRNAAGKILKRELR